MSIDIKKLFRERLNDEENFSRWDGRCCFCGEGHWTELCHNVSDSKATRAMIGVVMTDMPLLQTIPGCRECNSGPSRGYSRFPKHITPAVVNAARLAWVDYLKQTYRGKV